MNAARKISMARLSGAVCRIHGVYNARPRVNYWAASNSRTRALVGRRRYMTAWVRGEYYVKAGKRA